MTGAGAWPHFPSQCPSCAYLQEYQPSVDDSGYEIVSFCRHPRIAMELFRPQQRESIERDRCPLHAARLDTERG
jgi:hypothetical protein